VDGYEDAGKTCKHSQRSATIWEKGDVLSHNRTLFASSDACICSRASDMIARPLMARCSSCTLSPITANKVLYLVSGTWHKPQEDRNGRWLNPHDNLHRGH
jgi:hypothetical protein